MKNWLQHIEKAALFKGLDKVFLQEILNNAKVKFYEEEKILFLEEDKALKFYILLDGAVKMFSRNSSGEEAIISIIEAGHFINDPFCELFCSSAEVAKGSFILSISLPQFRNFLKSNATLTANMLFEMSTQNQEIFFQIKRAKLGDAQQRVGNFLLRNSVKNDCKATEIDLACSKSEIASYLGLRPETLSRILYKLQEDGEIAVEKNKIVLLKKNSLCTYCDSDVMHRCKNRDKDFCEY